MSQQEEYQKLARKFVDLWQENMAAMLNDGELIHTLMTMMQGGGFSAKDYMHVYPDITPSAGGQPTGGPTTASDARDAALDRLAYSLAAIEKRLERLERDAAVSAANTGSSKAKRSVGRTARRPKTRSSSRGRSTKKSH